MNPYQRRTFCFSASWEIQTNRNSIKLGCFYLTYIKEGMNTNRNIQHLVASVELLSILHTASCYSCVTTFCATFSKTRLIFENSICFKFSTHIYGTYWHVGEQQIPSIHCSQLVQELKTTCLIAAVGWDLRDVRGQDIHQPRSAITSQTVNANRLSTICRWAAATIYPRPSPPSVGAEAPRTAEPTAT